MRYIWIIILTIFYILGWIATIYDIWDTYQYNKYIEDDSNYPFQQLDPFTGGWLVFHVLIIFLISFLMWYAG